MYGPEKATVFDTATTQRLAMSRSWPAITCVVSSSLVKISGAAMGNEAERCTCVRCRVECQYIDGQRSIARSGVTGVVVVLTSSTNCLSAVGRNASPTGESRTQTSTLDGATPRLCSSTSGKDEIWTLS